MTGRMEEFLETIAVAATLLDGFSSPFYYKRDTDDAHYVNLALAAHAELFVSRDRDLLAEFQRQYAHLRIVDPVGFLREIDADAR